VVLRPRSERESRLTREDGLRVAATTESIRLVLRFLRDAVRRLPLTDDVLFDIDLAVEEACANIVQHAYGPDQAGEMEVRVEATDAAIRIVLTDWGQPFDADAAYLARGVPAEVRAKGGMGVLLIHEAMDSVKRTPASAPGGPNVLTLVKQIGR
jgi:serine/threonine-protein kinase RsbW